MAEKLAAQTGQAKLESVADVNEAALAGERPGNLNEALRLYQQALQLDDATGDNIASAVDWFAYGRFLDESGFPARLAYACMVKSESLAQSLAEAGSSGDGGGGRSSIGEAAGCGGVAIRRTDPARDALRVSAGWRLDKS